MPGTNQFLPFAVGAGANTLTPTAYAALTSLLSVGFTAGVAPSAQFNTALRQATTAAAGVAQFIANQGQNVNDDGSPTNFASALASALLSVAAAAVSFATLSLSASGTSASVSVSAAEILLRGNDGSARLLTNVNLTLNSAGTGANGLDTGSLAASTWYSVWVIHNGTTAATLMSLSATAPTMPSGYTHKARVGWIRTDGTANKWPLAFKQAGRRIRTTVSGNVSGLPVLVAGIQGNINTPTWVSASLANYVPSTAAEALLVVAGASTGTVMAAPTSAYGAYNSATNQPPVVVSIGTTSRTVTPYSMLLESAAIYYASDLSSGQVFCGGWEDNL